MIEIIGKRMVQAESGRVFFGSFLFARAKEMNARSGEGQLNQKANSPSP